MLRCTARALRLVPDYDALIFSNYTLTRTSRNQTRLALTAETQRPQRSPRARNQEVGADFGLQPKAHE
jgi:hypothetical protein